MVGPGPCSGRGPEDRGSHGCQGGAGRAGQGRAEADSAGLRNGADSVGSRNGAGSGADSVVSRNGAGSGADSTLKAERSDAEPGLPSMASWT